MTYTLSQYAKLEKNPLKKGIMSGLAEEGLITSIMTWRSTNSMNEAGVRFDSVPTPAYIPIDGTIAEATVDGHQIQHSVYELAHHMDIPCPLEDLTGDLLTKPSAQQIKLALKGAAYKVNDQFVNGDQGVDPNGFNGLRHLVANLASTQTVAPSAQLDLTAGTYSSDTSQDAIDLINLAYHRVEGHKPSFVLSNSETLLKFESILRREKLLGDIYDWKSAALEVDSPRMSQDSPGANPAFTYRGIPWYDLGTTGDQTTEIIGNSYTHGTGSGETEIFMVKMADDQLEGIQAQPLDVKEIGLLQDKEVYRYRLIWIHGLALWGPRSVVQVNGLKVA